MIAIPCLLLGFQTEKNIRSLDLYNQDIKLASLLAGYWLRKDGGIFPYPIDEHTMLQAQHILKQIKDERDEMTEKVFLFISQTTLDYSLPSGEYSSQVKTFLSAREKFCEINKMVEDTVCGEKFGSGNCCRHHQLWMMVRNHFHMVMEGVESIYSIRAKNPKAALGSPVWINELHNHL